MCCMRIRYNTLWTVTASLATPVVSSVVHMLSNCPKQALVNTSISTVCQPEIHLKLASTFQLLHTTTSCRFGQRLTPTVTHSCTNSHACKVLEALAPCLHPTLEVKSLCAQVIPCPMTYGAALPLSKCLTREPNGFPDSTCVVQENATGAKL